MLYFGGASSEPVRYVGVAEVVLRSVSDRVARWVGVGSGRIMTSTISYVARDFIARAHAIGAMRTLLNDSLPPILTAT